MGTLSGTPYGNEINSKILISIEGAEDIKGFKNRIFSFLGEKKNKESCILMVAHAGIARMIETIQKDLNLELFYDLPAPKNAEVLKIF